MRFSSYIPSFALFAFSISQAQVSVADLHRFHYGHLQHHHVTNGHSIASPEASNVLPTRRRKKCSTGITSAASAVSGFGTGAGGTSDTVLSAALPNARSSTTAGLHSSSDASIPAQSSGSGNSPLSRESAGTCQPQSTVTVTSDRAVTVTVTTSSVGGSSNTADSPIGSSALLESSATLAYSTPVAPLSLALSSAPYGSGNISAPAPTGTGVAAPCGNISSSSIVAPILAAVSSLTASSAGASSDTVSGSVRLPSATSSAGPGQDSNGTSLIAPSSNSSSGSIAPHEGEFWAGATIGCLPRQEAIPGRVYYGFDGKTVEDPVKTFGDAGLNAFRLETFRHSCLGPSHFVNNASTLSEELLFTLDWGCIDLQVKMAQRARAAGMKRFQLTINQGFTIPKELESLNYAQMIDNIKGETKRQLQPFLDVGIVPDVILLENEGSDGFLFTEESTGHNRGQDDGKASTAKLDQERCAKVPTGKMDSYPQYAGYLKAEINAAIEAITAAGFSASTTRYGLHSHVQYVQWKEGFVHGPDQHSQSDLISASGDICSGPNPIPADLLAQNVTTMMEIMGFSAYPEDDFSNLKVIGIQLQGYADAMGRHTDGPFAGQYKWQMLGVEYATEFSYANNAAQVAQTEALWEVIKPFKAWLGLLWYEAWYCYGDWEGGDAALCHRITSDPKITGEAPTNTLKAWAKGAVSPWL